MRRTRKYRIVVTLVAAAGLIARGAGARVGGRRRLDRGPGLGRRRSRLVSTSPTVRAGSSSRPGGVAATLLYLSTGQVLKSSTGKVITRLWTGQARSMSVGNGYVVAVLESSPRVMDVFGLPGT